MMFKTDNLTTGESIDLSNEIIKVGEVNDTPLFSLLMANRKVGRANGKLHSWREITYDNTDNVNVVEGNKDIQFYQSARAELNNPCAIWEKGVSVSGTVDALNIKGQSNIFSSEVADRLQEVRFNIDKSITSDTRNDGSSSPYIRKVDGIEQWAHTDNIIVSATPNQVSEEDIKATMKKLWDQGIPGQQFYGLVNYEMKEMIDQLYYDKYYYQAETERFGILTSQIKTNAGILNLIVSRNASPDKLTIFNLNYLSLDYIRRPQFIPLAKTGDSVDGFIVAEGTLKVGSKKAVAQLQLASE